MNEQLSENESLPEEESLPERPKVSVTAEVHASLPDVWEAWVTPGAIQAWNFAVDEWCCPEAEIDLQPGGKFRYRMESRDGAAGFDFAGTFTRIDPHRALAFDLGDQRNVQVEFTETPDGVQVSETFEAEDENSAEQQRHGWQRILNNFKRYVEEQGK